MNEWGSKGYIVSDCWAISDFCNFRGKTPGPTEAAALALKSGTDLECGVDYRRLTEAVEKGLAAEEDIDRAVKKVMKAPFMPGMFDPDSIVEYTRLPFMANCSDYNRSLARQTAGGLIVLLKNSNGTLPLSRDVGKVAMIGPNAMAGRCSQVIITAFPKTRLPCLRA